MKRENWDPFKKHERKIKSWMGISTRNSDKKSTKTGKNDKTKEKRWKNLEQKRKDNTRKAYKGINQKVLAKEGRLKRYRQRVKR